MARKSLEDAFKDYENAKPVDAQAVQDARGQLIDAQTKMRALSAEAEQIKLVQHNKTKLTLAKSRVRTLRSEVDNCVGEMSMYTGESVTEASIDDDIREDDPTEGEILAGDPLDSERPYDMTPSMPR
jgi:exonuclease VII small subunit